MMDYARKKKVTAQYDPEDFRKDLKIASGKSWFECQFAVARTSRFLEAQDRSASAHNRFDVVP
jgi:hypothetical protein